MLKRIQSMADDQFDFTAPEAECSPARIVLSAEAGNTVQGSFSVVSKNGVPLRGLVYSTNPYVTLSRDRFEGLSTDFPFTAEVPGALPGEVLEGVFVAACSQLVLEIPYRISFEEPRLETSAGVLESLADFARLARDNWDEALRLFFSDTFGAWMETQDPHTRLLYRGYRRGMLSSANLEEFLVAAGQKSRIDCDVPTETRRYEFVTEDRRESVEIGRSGWGYLDLSAESDASFLEVEPPEVQADQFLGRAFVSRFYIRADRLHPGRNYGRITYTSGGRSQVLTVIASKGASDGDQNKTRIKIKTLILRAFRDYESWRLDRLGVTEWGKRWQDCLGAMEDLDAEQALWYRLLSVMPLLEGGRREEAVRAISGLRREVSEEAGRERALLLYLCILLDPESREAAAMRREISRIRTQDPADLILFWLWIVTDAHLAEDPSAKYRTLAAFASERAGSPLLFLEGYDILLEHPYLLSATDGFSVGLLEWVRKRKAMTSALAARLPRLVSGRRISSGRDILPLLCQAYEAFPDRDLLEQIILRLLAGRLTGERWLLWYRRAIESELHLAGIYEGYLMSVPAASLDPLPREVTRFFHLQGTLPAERYAALYAFVVQARKKDTETYELYLPMMDSFIREQMRQGRIDENLAILYRDYLRRNPPDTATSEAMAPLIFVHKIASRLPDLSRVFLLHDQLDGLVMATARDGTAYLPVYTRENVVFLEDLSGTLTADRTLIHIEPLFDIPVLYAQMQPRIPEALPYLIRSLSESADRRIDMSEVPEAPKIEATEPERRFSLEPQVVWDGLKGRKSVPDAPVEKQTDLGEDAARVVTAADPGLRMILQLLASRQIREEEKRLWYPQAIAYLRSVGREDHIRGHFAAMSSLDGVEPVLRGYILSSWIRDGQFRKAYVSLRRYPAFALEPDALELLLLHLIETNGSEWQDPFLLSFFGAIPLETLRDERVLTYLAAQYVGPTERMTALWDCLPDKTRPEAVSLGEHILIQMLYTERFLPEKGSVFEAVLDNGGSGTVCAAYVNYWSRKSLLETTRPEDGIFPHIFSDMTHGRTVSDSARYALMKRLATAAALSDAEFALLDGMVSEALDNHVRFAFFRRMDRRLVMKYQLFDRFFIELHDTCGRRLIISWQTSEQSARREEMQEVYPGIYCFEFLLFYGQQMRYRIAPASDPDQVLREDVVRFSGMLRPGVSSRYDLLCRMGEEREKKDADRIFALLREYREKQEMAEGFFDVR